MSPRDMLGVAAADRPEPKRRAREAQRGECLARMLLGLAERDSLVGPLEDVHSFVRAEDVLALCECIAAQHPEWLDSEGHRDCVAREIARLD